MGAEHICLIAVGTNDFSKVTKSGGFHGRGGTEGFHCTIVMITTF